MPIPKTLSQARQNFDQATATLGPRYEAAVKRADWLGPASSDLAESNFSTSMQRALQAKSRQAGVRKVSNADWQNAAVNKGAAVIGQRTKDALGKWETSFGPIYQQVVDSLPGLPGKTTDFRSNINNRLVRVVETWKRASGKL